MSFLKRPLRACAMASSIALCAGFAAPAAADVALWSLQGPSGGRAVLMGTIHLLPEDPSWQSKGVKKAVDGADALVLEALMDESNVAQIRAVSMTEGFYPDPKKGLSTVLPEADLARLTAIQKTLDMPPGVFESMRPWFAALNMSIAYAMSHGFEPGSGAEQWLRTQFTKQNRPIGPLETPTAGLIALAAMPADVQLDMLRGAMAQVEAGNEDITKLHAAWLAGDVDALKALVLDPNQFDPDVHDVILTQRNANWVAPLLNYLKTPEEELIAVGAAHMVGPGNLIEMLEAAGVTVERME